MNEYNKPICVCGITTRYSTAKVMVDGFEFLNKNGFKTFIICEPNDAMEALLKDKNIEYIPIAMKAGRVSIFEIIRQIRAFRNIFRKYKFDIIQYASSNASLYASIAGKQERIKIRILCQWGLTYLGFKGIKRFVYKLAEKITCRFSTNVQPDSHSNLEFAIKEHLFKRKKGNVIWNGSACGIDFERFDISKKEAWRKQLFKKYALPDNALVFGFVGRIVKDKGVNELLEAFNSAISLKSNIYLFVVGSEDGVFELDKGILTKAKNNKNIVFTGPINNVPEHYGLFDYVVMPSYREGFSMVLLESAAMGVPVLSSNICGSLDFVKNDHNGFVFDVKSSSSLCDTILKAYSISKDLYKALSSNAFNEAKSYYDIKKFREYYLEDRRSLVKALKPYD